MAANSRESRRRKILERGPDRLAFITGRIPSPPQLPPQLTTDSSQPLVSTPESHPPDQTTASPDVEDKGNSHVSGSVLPKQDSGLSGARGTGSSVEPPLAESGIGVEANGNVESSSPVVSLTDQNPSVSTSSSVERDLEPRQIFQHRFLTPSRIKSAIVATELARLFCSVAAAVLVVLSCLLGSNCLAKSILSLRPLYIVLLTNITIVVLQLLTGNQGGSERANRGEIKIPLMDSSGWAEQASKLLEVGLVMRKVIDAFFIACSVYSLIVICGLSFANLGS